MLQKLILLCEMNPLLDIKFCNIVLNQIKY